MKILLALLGENADVVNKSRFQMGHIFKLTNNLLGTKLENYDDWCSLKNILPLDNQKIGALISDEKFP
jgi:hypothetical protein